MAVVVSDTSPIRALRHLGLELLLPDLFGEVLIPPAVAEELRRPRLRFVPIDPASLPGVTVKSPQNAQLLAELRRALDPGEAEAICLALDVHATAVIMDERAGRQEAGRLGLVTVGVIGILLRAKQHGRIPKVAPLLNELRMGLGFHVHPAVYRQALEDAAESNE